MSTITFDVDAGAVTQALRTLPAELERRVQAASEITARRIAAEAQRRLRAQLGPDATGTTVAGIEARPSKSGRGWVVLADHPDTPSLPLWLEKGTRAGKRRNGATIPPRPFFYAAALLETEAHARRVRDAMAEAATAVGLGE